MPSSAPHSKTIIGTASTGNDTADHASTKGVSSAGTGSLVAEQTDSVSSSPLAGRIICVDPGHGGTADSDSYRVGPTGEREEWINLRVALALRDKLKACGARVVMTRTDDTAVELKARADLAVAAGADVFLSIHHNATADRSVNFPIIYFHGNAGENQASVRLAKILGNRINRALFAGRAPVSVVSDHTIFPEAGAAVLRHSYGIPGVIGEASFFSNPEEERRLKDPAWNEREAEAYRAALEEFFSAPASPILDKYSTVRIEPFAVAQEAGRMNPDALKWREDFEDGKHLLQTGDGPAAWELALGLLERSARNFPDSPVARACHLWRAEALERLGRSAEAQTARRRVAQFYPE
ncbi:MAG: hypothetical protein Kow0059_11530 [Candidatus Sumerlaeia bacterium]